ncbi:ImmA/IrrE family metallo-endopeptidase [Lacipirellula parvula]|uniref:IrrE N-terminal-like domain-containing protein n=1 Tax=Lacipirellula parvula TaxID=2650471 RepID=A0A5K7XDQ4_9BACT|nr:ImmA/IrrE family metallo-endopeptidase [Lacipirellula parvula]BBO34177.1 hypothetical protein PLANPX_3789 [Lacipirellula parvula]
MAKANDYLLPDAQRALIQKHAKLALERAGAFGVFPTPIDEILDASKLVVSDDDLADEGLIAHFRRKAKAAGQSLRRAINKVMGALDAVAKIIYLDRTLHVAKIAFIKLHEAGHAVLPWQRDIYSHTEDCEVTLAPEIAEEFEREANTFAADVIFQINKFTEEANQYPFGILVPVRLSKRYGASIYMSVRRYVTESHRACMVLVLEPPKIAPGGFSAEMRREVASPSFLQQFGPLSWPASFGPDDEIGRIVPLYGRKMSRPREITLVDRNKVQHKCVAEAFTQTHQVFILIHSVATLKRLTVSMTG